MLNVFKGTLVMLVRDKAIFIWSLAFPLILSTLFVFMFSHLDDAGRFEPVRTAVVANASYEEAPGFAEMIDALSQPGDDQMLDVVRVSSEEEAVRLMRGTAADGSTATGKADESVIGYLMVSADGEPSVHVRGGTTPDSIDSANQSILKVVVDNYLRSSALVEDVARENPAALSDARTVERLLEVPDLTEKIDVTQNPPKESARFYFALLAMAALFGGQVGMVAICRTQPNLSALGARWALGAVSRRKTLAATLGASWLLAFACLAAAYAFVRLVAGVDFGGRDAACIAVLAASSLLATAVGTLLGSIAKLSEGVKGGLLSGIVCFASLFAGLYGSPVMKLADTINATMPALQFVNPAVQISQAFYSIMYYDTYQRTIEHVAVLLAMTAVLFAVSLLFIGRQRYASL